MMNVSTRVKKTPEKLDNMLAATSTPIMKNV